jgi:rhodanese-related sulfurtransferase
LFVSLQCTAKATAQASVAASPYLIERVANNDWLLIDVRSPQEFADGHIPGAVNMPHENINDYLSELEGHKNKPIIIYCRSGRRAKLAMKVLEELDFSEVMHLEGDMLGWSAAGMTVDRM